MSTFGRSGQALVLAALLGGAVPSWAAEFHLYLDCQGKVASRGQAYEANLLLAMRDNNNTALIQKSNVLPVGERLKYVASELSYTLTYRTPGVRSRVYMDWMRGGLFIWQPDLKKLAETRLTIDRQTGELRGDLINVEGEMLGNLKMACEPRSPEDMPAPRF